jgi:hypothetical protein
MHKVGVHVTLLLLLIIAASVGGYALAGQHWVLVGIAALWCVGGFALLAPARPASSADLTAHTHTDTARTNHSEMVVEPATDASRVDLAAAAALCTALSRVTRTSDLPPLLAQAANLLDAPGIILWMGAGEQLFAVTAHGYAPEVLTRLGPISRGADNATAAAWRSAQLATVAGDATANGAVVVPLFRADTCIGALAIELRHGREGDRSTHAVALMIAAQLAAVVPAWPTASTASTPEIRSATA